MQLAILPPLIKNIQTDSIMVRIRTSAAFRLTCCLAHLRTFTRLIQVLNTLYRNIVL